MFTAGSLISDVFVGLLGAVIIGLGSLVLRLIRDFVINRRHPIAGEYASTFEDYVDGERTLAKATARLSQRGRRIYGPTTMAAGGRTWMLEGRLTKNGRVYGNYESQDLHDDGSGGFFLEMKPGKRLEGFWAGYDSVNNSVTAGKYTFWPLKKIPAIALGPADLDQALSVLGSELGYKFVSRDELSSYSRDTDKLALISKDAEGVMGAVTGRIFETVDDFLESLPQDKTEALRGCLPGLDFNKIGLIKSVAVDRSMQGRGIASGLVDAATNKLWSLGATLIVSIGWTDADGCHIQGVFDAAHFSTKGDIPDFWRQDSLDKGYSCPTCGTPCRCIARIFSKHRRDSGPVADNESMNAAS